MTRLSAEQHDTLVAVIGRREWSKALTSIERATLVIDHCSEVGIGLSLRLTPPRLSAAMACMPLNAQDISNYADMACALAAVLPTTQPQSVNTDLLASPITMHKPDRRKRPAPIAGTAVIWPAGVEQRYGISAVTRWRWERAKKLPDRDVHIGGRSGWKPETLAAIEKATQVRA